jgi:hypothetical protein
VSSTWYGNPKKQMKSSKWGLGLVSYSDRAGCRSNTQPLVLKLGLGILSMLFLLLAMLSVISLVVLSTLMGSRLDSCNSNTLLQTSIIILVSCIYYAIVRACGALLVLIMAVRNEKGNYANMGHVPDTGNQQQSDRLYTISEGTCTEVDMPVSPAGSSLSDFDFGVTESVVEIPLTDPIQPTNPKRYRKGELYSVAKAWSNIYGLGLGLFCLVYSFQMQSLYGNVVLCLSFLAVAGDEYIQSCKAKAANVNNEGGWAMYYRRLVLYDTHTFFWMPLMFLIYTISLILHITAALELSIKTNQSTVENVLSLSFLIPVIAPLCMTCVKRPDNLVATIELSVPIAGMISLCSLSILVATSSTCMYSAFHDIDGNMVIYPEQALTALISPIAAIFTLIAILSANDAKRSFDISVIVLGLASTRLYLLLVINDASNVGYNIRMGLVYFLFVGLVILRSRCCGADSGCGIDSVALNNKMSMRC